MAVRDTDLVTTDSVAAMLTTLFLNDDLGEEVKEANKRVIVNELGAPGFLPDTLGDYLRERFGSPKVDVEAATQTSGPGQVAPVEVGAAPDLRRGD